jgi:VWFA-related protein
LKDDGVQQALQMQPDQNLEPLALAVIVETGGQGASHLHDYANLGAVIDAVIGDVPHRVAVISFGGAARLEQDFTPDTDAAAQALANLHASDSRAAILDALAFGIKLLSKQPIEYRRAVLLISESADRGSQIDLDDAVRAVDDTNTSVYSFGFSTADASVKHEASKLPMLGGSKYTDQAYAPGGCMSADSDPDAHGNRSIQALDCASDLLPPLRFARMAFDMAQDSFSRNVPQAVARLTGGEYFDFKDTKTLKQGLLTVSNDLPNYYVLSFRPQAPQPGMHSLQVRLPKRDGIQIRARRVYWVDQ